MSADDAAVLMPDDDVGLEHRGRDRRALRSIGFARWPPGGQGKGDGRQAARARGQSAQMHRQEGDRQSSVRVRSRCCDVRELTSDRWQSKPNRAADKWQSRRVAPPQRPMCAPPPPPPHPHPPPTTTTTTTSPARARGTRTVPAPPPRPPTVNSRPHPLIRLATGRTCPWSCQSASQTDA